MNREATRRTVVVTGGAGYIGSHTCKRLSERGYVPVTVDNLERGHRDAVRWGPLEQGDTRDAAFLRNVFQRYRPFAVIHFAAYAYVGEAVEKPNLYYKNNVSGTIQLLDQMVDSNVRGLVFSSTCNVYGEPDRDRIDESHPKVPINPYGRSKWFVEQIISDFQSAFDMSAIVLRYFNAAGADPDGEIGEDHDPEPHLIPRILRSAESGTDPIRVFGNDYDTPDGTCVRDYVHVTDLAEAHILALEALDDQAGHLAFNVGTGTGNSVMEVIDSARRITGVEIPVEIGERRPGDAPVLVADASKIDKELGWAPRYSDLDEIMETAWRWHSRDVRS